MNKERCETCKYHGKEVRIARDEYRLVCNRYPTPAIKMMHEVCGEYKPIAKGKK